MATRKQLEAEGFTNTEQAKDPNTGEPIFTNPKSVKLGGHGPDMFRPNKQGGTDYVEVGKMNNNGTPAPRERGKMQEEIDAMGPNDTMTFVDAADPSRRISYTKGEKVDSKVGPIKPRKNAKKKKDD